MLKRGTRIAYTYASGAVVMGKVLRSYSAKEIAAHVKSHGPEAAAQLPNWYPCELYDEAGTYRGACHISQLRVIGNQA